MKDKKTRDAILKFRLIRMAISICCFTLGCLIALFVDNVALVLVLVFLTGCVTGRLYNWNEQKNLYYTLYNGLNIDQYTKLLSSVSGSNVVNLADAYYLAGDYQTAINLSVNALKKKKHRPYHKCRFLYLIMNSYALIGDLDKARNAYDHLCCIFNSAKNGRKIKASFLAVDFFGHYFDGDLDACLEDCLVYSMCVEKFFYNNVNYKILCINPVFFRGMVYYRQGEFEKAKQCFEKVSADEFCTRVSPNIVVLSKKYLEAIDAVDEGALKFPEMLPQDNCEVCKKKFRQGFINKICYFVLVGLLVLYFACRIITTFIPEPTGLDLISREDKAELYAALSEDYDKFEVLKLFWVEHNGKTIESFCIVETEDGVDLHSVVVIVDSGKIDTNLQYEGLSADSISTMWTTDGDYFVRYCVCGSEDEIPEDSFQTEEITVDGDTLYFCVLSIMPS